MSSLTAVSPFWTATQVARRLNIPRHRVYQYARSGRLPCLRIGRTLRFDPDALASWAKRGGWASPSVRVSKQKMSANRGPLRTHA
jgi:excisionase family DNA binding protein